MDKIVVRLMKEAIKSQVAAQKERKKAFRDAVANRRKNGGQLVCRPWQIAAERESLRHLYAAYSLARGKDMAYVNAYVDRESQRLGRHKKGPLAAWTLASIAERFANEAEAQRKKEADANAAMAKASEEEAHAPRSE